MKMEERTVLKGNIFNMERCAIYDGPGVRTVLFLKGCQLRCRWCSTPQSHNLQVEVGYYSSKCARCAKCLTTCPLHAIRIDNEKRILTDTCICNNCAKCVEICPTGARALIGREVTVDEVMEEIGKDAIFYWNSGGGVTLSGGEPLLQPAFSREILRRCQDQFIHTTMETSGYADWDIFRSLLEYVDLLYLDIKHMSPNEHEKLTGRRNDQILENALRVSKEYEEIELIVRIPVVPGRNDSEKNILETVAFTRRLRGVQKIELLPYHKLGITNYEVLLMNYTLEDLEPPSGKYMLYLKQLIESNGLEAQIGG